MPLSHFSYGRGGACSRWTPDQSPIRNSIYYTQAKVMGNIKIRNWKSQVWYLEMFLLESRKNKFSKQKCTY